MARKTKKFWTAIVKEGSIYKTYCGYCTEKNCAAWASICLFDRYSNLRETPGRLFFIRWNTFINKACWLG